jgi:hypothetical protein
MAEEPTVNPQQEMRKPLTVAQRLLLDEIINEGGLYVHRYMRYGRTINALERKGYVRCDERDYSRFGSDHFVAVDA